MKRLCATAVFMIAVSPMAAHDQLTRPLTPGSYQPVQQVYAKLPLSFEMNAGQTASEVKFISRGSGYTLFLTPGEAVVALQKAGDRRQQNGRAVVRMKLDGASRNVRLAGSDARAGSVNYLVGDRSRWRRGVPTYARVLYRGVYPGIDLVFHGSQGELEYDFVVAPGADPAAIRLAFEGATLAIDAGGDLLGTVSGGSIRMRKPVLYQERAGVRVPVQGAWALTDAHHARFRVEAYDRTTPLVIDPVLSYSTYLGGRLDDTGIGIAVDALGNSYVTGATTSVDFPVAGAAVQPALAGSNDAFVTKLDPTGSTLVYSTYLGGSGSDAGTDIAVDASGHAHVTGATLSADFPTAAANQTFGGETDVFVAKLDPTGTTLIYSTFLGGSDVDSSNGIALDAAGNAYVAGSSLSPNFPTTAGAYQPIPRSGLPAPPTFTPSRYDAFVTKLAPAGPLVYSTYLGGTDAEVGADIAVDTSGNAYITGSTRSIDFPTTPGAFQSTGGGFSEAGYVTKLNAAGSALQYSTYLRGSSHDFGAGIAVDAAGNAYVTGGTMSDDFPTTVNAAQSVFGGDADAFIARLDITGTALEYSTYLGSGGQEWADDIAVDSAGNAYVVGTTRSTDFPTTTSSFQPAYGGGFYDAFVAKLNAAGTATVYSSYLGSSGEEFASAVAVDSAGSAYVTGFVVATDFPITAGSVQPAFGGDRDAFVVKIADAAPSSTLGKVTGGGSVALGNGVGTFAFVVQRHATDEPIQGNLQYVDHATGARLHAVTFTALSIAGDTATIEGTCRIDRAPCTFAVTITDGEGAGEDAFVIRVSAGTPEGGVLRGGTVRIHP